MIPVQLPLLFKYTSIGLGVLLLMAAAYIVYLSGSRNALELEAARLRVDNVQLSSNLKGCTIVNSEFQIAAATQNTEIAAWKAAEDERNADYQKELARRKEQIAAALKSIDYWKARVPDDPADLCGSLERAFIEFVDKRKRRADTFAVPAASP